MNEDSSGDPSCVIQSGPKPPSNHWPPGHPQMAGPSMMPPMQGYGTSPQMMGSSNNGPPMMGPMHGLHSPHPSSHMQRTPSMYGTPYGMHVPSATMMNPHPANMIHKNESSSLRHSPFPLPKENQITSKVSSPIEIPIKKSDAIGGMTPDELAMLGIDIGDMAAQSF